MSSFIMQVPGIILMRGLGTESVQLVWTDPPYGTGSTQKLKSTGEKYRDPSPDEALELSLQMTEEAQRVLTPSGVLAVCLDRRIVHSFVHHAADIIPYVGEVIWHYETGGTSKKFWSQKHETIALFCKGTPLFNLDKVPTVERKAPVTRGQNAYTGPKRVSSVWNINMSTTDPQRVGYPSQKPLALVKPFIEVHTNPDDLVVDPFCGSGTTIKAARDLGRRGMGSDINPAAVELARSRMSTKPSTKTYTTTALF